MYDIQCASVMYGWFAIDRGAAPGWDQSNPLQMSDVGHTKYDRQKAQ